MPMPMQPPMPPGGGGMPPQGGPTGPMGGSAGGEMPQMSPPGQPQLPEGQGGPQQPMPGAALDEPTGMQPDQNSLVNMMNATLSDMNIAKKFEKKEDKDHQDILTHMGAKIVEGFNNDVASRKDWMDKNETWLKMATLLAEPKSFPWPKAANVKYPLLSTAAMQFSARAYPALVPTDGQIVKTKVTQANPQPQLYDAAERISKFMSYQLMNTIPNWEEEMDRLLMIMSITGICFKETYHDSLAGCHRSQLVHPSDLVINYWAKSIEDAYRKTRILRYSDNEVETKFRDGSFLRFDLPKPEIDPRRDNWRADGGSIPQVDKATPHIFLACHTYWDLDEDGYEEPYIIVVHEKSQKVVRIIARWDLDGVTYDEQKKQVVTIKPVEYFTAFPFIPNPDGSIYALGFGTLLGPLNQSVDTGINQLLDAGTLNNMQGGFIGKGLRLKIGQTNFQPGEWKVVNATGDDLSKNIFPLPMNAPSTVVLELVNMLITSGNQLASIAEIFVGKMPGQNTPATTTQETIQQGMAVFTAIYKRVYRSLQMEFRKLYRLNKISPSVVQDESFVAGVQLQASDFDLPENLIIPGADPSGDSSTVKMAKMQAVGQLISLGTINTQVYTMRMLQANDVPNAQELIAPPQPPAPDPKAQALQMKGQIDQQKAQMDMQAKQQDMDLKKQMAEMEMQLESMKLQFEQTRQAMDLQGKQTEMHMNHVAQVNEMQMDAAKQQHDVMLEKVKAEQALAQQSQVHQQSMQQSGEAHKAKLQQTKAESRLKPKGKAK